MIGKTISQYKIIEKLGEGGMGVVYKAQDTKLDRIVALKFLPESLCEDKKAKTRFVHEAKAASALNHTNITTIYEIDEVEGECFICMEYVEGVSLKQKTAVGAIHESPLQMQDIINYAIQIAEGLNAAHKKGIVHRDVKSDNIMVTDEGLAKKLKDNGLNIVYLSFDSFHEEFNQKIRGRPLVNLKLQAIDVCRKHDMEVILVNTLMKSLNDKEVGDMIRFAAKNTDIVRGLIFQPIAFTGRATENPFRENFREWSFAEDVETQTGGEIKATDLYPMSVMTSPIKIMRKFMQKPWPLFSCSPQCGIVNWIYVSKSGKMFPINRFVNFDRFFNSIRKTAESAESKGKMSLLSSLFMASMISMDMLLVTKEVGMPTLLKSIMRMHLAPSYQSLGKIRRRIFLLGCMAFMDSYNFDVNRVRRCVVHYITPDKKIIPFCAYNNVHRVAIEKDYAERQKKALPPQQQPPQIKQEIPLIVPQKIKRKK